MKRIVVTGGAGFIGSHVCEALLDEGHLVVCLDNLTYAGNADALASLTANSSFEFHRGDITKMDDVAAAIHDADVVINCAAETHVDRSIWAPAKFAHTDNFGVAVLLESCIREGVQTFVQVSTDEVYGEVLTGAAGEEAPMRSRSPYAASKAGADLFAQAVAHTYGLDVRITRGCNTYGPRQHPEKFIALMATNAIDGVTLPIYGDGLQVREWIAVEDHARAILAVLHRGEANGIYNVGSGERLANIDVARMVLKVCGRDDELLGFVQDRPGHDRRYAVDAGRIHGLGWAPLTKFEVGLPRTVAWYQANPNWWREIKSAEHDYFDQMYANRSDTGTVVRGGMPAR